MKITFSFKGHNNTVSPALSTIETNALEVMPTEMPKVAIPAEVSVMPISTQRPKSNFIEELQTVLFGARIKVDAPREQTKRSAPVAPSTVPSSVKKVSVLSIGLLAGLTSSLALSTIAAKELRADDTTVIRQADSPALKAFMERREKVRGKMDESVNREVDNLTLARFTPQWSFVTVSLDAKGLTDEREQAILCPHGYVYRYDAQTRTASVAVPTRYLVTVANMPFVQQMGMDTQRP